ncbi:MAG: CoA-binding protein [Bacteroidetes bacterium]|nr:CoA-binding protein [Bacteroidota bacterium]MCL5025059.1 CoA-binding protein [Chloroflexota bacterium]
MEGLISEFIQQRVWAVVGASTNPEKFGNIIFRNLLAAGYKVYAVNPRRGEIEGHPFYPDLASLPEKPGVVDVVVPPKLAEKVLRECAAAGIERVWLQPGAESAEAIRLGEELGLKVVHHTCAMVHRRTW